MCAAHLPGEDGVLNLLREKGYTVRAVAFKQSKKADKEKQKIENTFRPNTFTTRYLPDSSLSISTPGKLYKLLGGANSFYIYPDMVNGAYYSVYVMNRFEAFTHQGVDYTVQRIDSLLYENIPGKILERKQSKTDEGHPCFDITNRNRRGDASRYRIVVTPEYVYYFMVNGTGDYVINHPDDRFSSPLNSAPSPLRGNGYVLPATMAGFPLKCPVRPTAM